MVEGLHWRDAGYIKEVRCDNVILGFMARRLYVFGVHDFQNLWCFTPSLTEAWRGAVTSRTKATEELLKIHNEVFKGGKR